ncbi:unnamed protein product [Psylliodes chrysocephalus]|uniref:Mitochondrial import receptor subunit TOM22 homolog n=1 Tax=Psylliodes chrysocephalus TaxID=3402493 RepID=A0A9P0CDS4_9CUCU|nr:unnamed protein product [Psylliodes chrysocephala]
MAPVEENDRDSGMESQEGSTFETEDTDKKRLEIEDDVEEEPDETFSERLWGLTEMFPEPIRNLSCTAATCTKIGVKGLYSFSRNALWVVFSTSIILFAPVVFEVERAQMEEMQKNQQKQLLLGPSSAMAGGVPPPIMPPMQKS